MIYTSYYANYRNFPLFRKQISISLYPPKGFKGEHYLPLAPTKSILEEYKNSKQDKKAQEIYTKRFQEEVLSKLDPKKIAKELDNSILLCFEKTGDFCHRHIVANWLSPYIKIKELEKEEKRIAVIGSRTFNDYKLFSFLLKRLISNYSKVKLVSGGARGADKLAEQFAKEYNIPIDIFLANWEKYGKSAGYKRNYTIWDNADLGIAFWDGESKGTKHSFEIAKNQKKDLYVYNIKTKKIEKI